MLDEFNALVKNDTGFLVPLTIGRCRLDANGFIALNKNLMVLWIGTKFGLQLRDFINMKGWTT